MYTTSAASLHADGGCFPPEAIFVMAVGANVGAAAVATGDDDTAICDAASAAVKAGGHDRVRAGAGAGAGATGALAGGAGP